MWHRTHFDFADIHFSVVRIITFVGDLISFVGYCREKWMLQCYCLVYEINRISEELRISFILSV